jgi:alanine racemase
MQSLMSRAWVEIDLGALARNGEKFARAAGVPLLPMVKADAYGIGAVRAARALLPLQPWGFGVATIEEGEELREAGITQPILVFSPVLAAQLDAMRRASLEPVLGDRETIARWVAAQQPWHLMIDTGMNRAGVAWREMDTVRAHVAAFPPSSVCTHFHSAELPDDTRAEQERRFAEAIAQLPSPPKRIHADNSGAIEHRSPSPYDLARPGIFLYGVGSGHDATIEPEPVVALRGRVVETRVVQTGDTVSYDGSWRAERPGRIATVSLGYADGLRRSLGNKGFALIKGARVPITGTVTMDMTMLDVTDHRCAVGEIATFIGSDGSASITVADVASAAGLSPYEILTGLRSRLPRVYRDGSDGT